MSMKCQWFAGSLAMAAGLMVGCQADMLYPTLGDVKQFDQIASARLDRHDEGMTQQHEIMHPKVAEKIRAIREETSAEFKVLDDKVKQIESNLLPLIKQAAILAAQMAGLPDSLTNSIMGKVGPRIDVVGTAATSAMHAATTAGSDATDVKTRLAELKKDLRDKLATATAATVKSLEDAEGNRKEFDELLRKELKLTPAQMESLSGMTTEQILALIAAAGGAAGIGVVGGRGGKSRSHEDIEKLKQALARLTADIERQKPPQKG